MPDSIRVENIRFSYGQQPLLKGISFAVNKREVLVITGRSGDGKSTLLEICAAMEKPDAGTVWWDDRNVAELSRRELYAARRSVGHVFQKHALISNLTIFDNLALPLRYHSSFTEKQIGVCVRRQMEECGLFGVDRSFPEVLSAGQLRCASLARALIMEPDMLFLDEPTSGLDRLTKRGIINVLRDLRAKRAVTIVMISHSMDAITGLQGRVAVVDDGRLVESDALQKDSGEGVPYVDTFLKEYL